MPISPPEPPPPAPDEPAGAHRPPGAPRIGPSAASGVSDPGTDRAAPLPAGALCPECNYDVRGLASVRCPECGTDLTDARARQTQIPWSYRRTLGGWRAFWRTVWFVTWNRRFAKQVAWPLDFADSQAFRWRCVAWAYLPALLVIGPVLSYPPLYHAVSGPGDLLAWGLSGLLVWLLLCLLALPGVTSYFVQSRAHSIEPENRLIAINYYAWAPLAWAPVFAAFLAAGMAAWYMGPVTAVQPNEYFSLALLGAGLGYLAALLMCLGNFYHVLRAAFPRGRTALLRWLAAAGACLVTAFLALLVPISGIWLALVWVSLT